MASQRSTVLIISQVYVPDPASVGQHMHDAAAALAARVQRVVVLASARGYDDPAQKYPSHERIDGVEVRRLPLSSLGKRTLAHRVVAQLAFLFQAVARGLMVRRLDRVLVSTSPPMCAFAAIVIGTLRRVPIAYWVMDLNPDQVVAMGRMKPTALPVRLMDRLNRAILRRAQTVVALDRFMAERLNRKRDVGGRMLVMPPWPHDTGGDALDHADNPFRARHGLTDKFVVMYSGNHSPANPLGTLVGAAARLRGDERLLFMFVGGGGAKAAIDALVEREKPANVRSLPYQPMSQLKYSLSAADLHVVTMGDEVVGCIHPCKVYGAMAVGRPILFFGPRPSHVTDLIDEAGCGWHVNHGDVDRAVELLREISRTPPGELAAMGKRGRELIHAKYAQDVLLPRFTDRVLGEGAGDG